MVEERVRTHSSVRRHSIIECAPSRRTLLPLHAGLALVRVWCVRVWCVRVWCVRVWCVRVWCVRVWCVRVWCVSVVVW